VGFKIGHRTWLKHFVGGACAQLHAPVQHSAAEPILGTVTADPVVVPRTVMAGANVTLQVVVTPTVSMSDAHCAGLEPMFSAWAACNSANPDVGKPPPQAEASCRTRLWYSMTAPGPGCRPPSRRSWPWARTMPQLLSATALGASPHTTQRYAFIRPGRLSKPPAFDTARVYHVDVREGDKKDLNRVSPAGCFFLSKLWPGLHMKGMTE
jgi:hypothetical protein